MHYLDAYKNQQFQVGNAGSPNTKYLNYPQSMEDIALEDPL